jgi:hypothetical protein
MRATNAPSRQPLDRRAVQADPRRERLARFRFVVLTTADFAAGGAGVAGASSLAGGGVGFGSSATGGVSFGVRRVAFLTIATAGAAFRLPVADVDRWA